MDFVNYKGFWVFRKAPHLSEILNKKQIVSLLSGGGYGVRNVYDWDCNKSSFYYVIKDSFGGLDELSSKKRTMVRKSLKTYDIKRVTAQEYIRVGLNIINSAIVSYKNHGSLITQEQLISYISAKEKNNNAEYWCVYERQTSTPVALAVNTVEDDSCNYNSMKCIPKYMHNSTYPYYGLIYEMNRYYLEERGLMYVNDGACSITKHSNIQQMLMDVFGFRKAYCKLQIEYQWWFGLIVKFLYPFRRFVRISKISAVLNMEQMRRDE